MTFFLSCFHKNITRTLHMKHADVKHAMPFAQQVVKSCKLAAAMLAYHCRADSVHVAEPSEAKQ